MLLVAFLWVCCLAAESNGLAYDAAERPSESGERWKRLSRFPIGLASRLAQRKLLQSVDESTSKTSNSTECDSDTSLENCNELNEEFFNATDHGESKTVQELISRGANVSTTNGYFDSTPLHVAAQEGYVDIVEMLIEAGATIDVQNGVGLTPLYVAARKGHLDVVKVLVEAGAAVDTPLGVAAFNGDVPVVEFLLKSGADIDAQNDKGATPLYWAAFHGHSDLAKALVKAGADVDAQNDEGVTPLYFAALFGYLDIAKVLVEAGATVDLRRDTGVTPLIVAAQNNETKIAEFLLESGADVNATSTANHQTSLHKAAYAGNPNLVQLLLDNGAEIDAQDEFGFTALFTGAFYGNGEAIEVLKKAGADLSVEDKNGNEIEDEICMCLAATTCREGTCGEGEKKRISAILKG